VSALYDSNGGHLHPLNYTLGLAAAAERTGVRIHEGTRALGFTSARVRTPGGEVRARHLVLCGNVYLGQTAPALTAKIMAVGTHIMPRSRSARSAPAPSSPTTPPSAT